MRLCGCQALAFRGHDDDGPVILDDDSVNHCKFRAFLRFRIYAGDLVLKEHLETASRNAIIYNQRNSK